MNVKKITGTLLMSAVLAGPVMAFAQDSYYEHEKAKDIQENSDARHHTKAKIVGGSAVGGAVVGGLAGGAPGAVVGAGAGAVGGLVVNKVRKDHDIKKREEHHDEGEGYRK